MPHCTDVQTPTFFLMYKILCLFDRLFLFFLSIPPPPSSTPFQSQFLPPQILDPSLDVRVPFLLKTIIFYLILFSFLCVEYYAVFVNRMQTLYVCTAGGAGVYRLSLEYCTVVFDLSFSRNKNNGRRIFKLWYYFIDLFASCDIIVCR
jgi:hypothetical protein